MPGNEDKVAKCSITSYHQPAKLQSTAGQSPQHVGSTDLLLLSDSIMPQVVAVDVISHVSCLDLLIYDPFLSIGRHDVLCEGAHMLWSYLCSFQPKNEAQVACVGVC